MRKFADQYDITYPLLSDADSTVIRQFGILNTNIPEDHDWYGVPFPGTFMTDAQGTVIEKSFFADHAVRDSVSRMLQDTFQVTDASHGPAQIIETDTVIVTAYLSSTTIRTGQVVTYTMDIEIKDGFHIYGCPLPEGYIPVSLTFKALEGVHYGSVTYPDPKPYHLEAINETLPVYENRISLKASVRNMKDEAFAVKACLEYQACDDQICYIPERLTFELSLDYLDNLWS